MSVTMHGRPSWLYCVYIWFISVWAVPQVLLIVLYSVWVNILLCPQSLTTDVVVHESDHFYGAILVHRFLYWPQLSISSCMFICHDKQGCLILSFIGTECWGILVKKLNNEVKILVTNLYCELNKYLKNLRKHQSTHQAPCSWQPVGVWVASCGFCPYSL